MRRIIRTITRADDNTDQDQPDRNDPGEDTSLHDDDPFEEIEDEKLKSDNETQTDFDDDFDVDDDDNLSLDGLDDGADGPEPDLPPPYLNHSGPSGMTLGDTKSPSVLSPPPAVSASAPVPAPTPTPASAPTPASLPTQPASEARLIDLDDEPSPFSSPVPARRSAFVPFTGGVSAGAPPPSTASVSGLAADLDGLRLNNPVSSAFGGASRSQHAPQPASQFSAVRNARPPVQTNRVSQSQPRPPQFSASQPNIYGDEDDDDVEELFGADEITNKAPGAFNPQPRAMGHLYNEAAPASRSQPRLPAHYDLATSPRLSRGPSTPLPPYSKFKGPPQPKNNARRAARGRPTVRMCVVCRLRPAYQNGGVGYPTCGLTCAAELQRSRARAPANNNNRNRNVNPNPANNRRGNANDNNPFRNGTDALLSFFQTRRSTSAPPARNLFPEDLKGRGEFGWVPCVICMARPARSHNIPTCGPECAERLCTGGADPRMCDYCHRRPKAAGYDQCGRTCGELAKHACLLCKSRPKFRKYHLCGKTCKEIATKWTPMLLEAPKEHETYKLVEKKFNDAWQGGPGEPLPKIRHIYKIFEGKTFLRPYDRYKRQYGNEIFSYHGTKRRCKLGSNGNTRLCNDHGCKLCQILKTSFSTDLANPRGSFGAGVYSSTSSNSAYFYTGKGTGAVIVSKVVLGRVHNVNAFNAVNSCPPGYNSVVFNRNNGARNETVVYKDEAIRPVFLIVFG